MSEIDLDEDALEAACKAFVGEAASYHFAFFADGWTKDYVRINAKRLAEPAIREYLRLTALQSGVSETGKGGIEWRNVSTAGNESVYQHDPKVARTLNDPSARTDVDRRDEG